MAQSRFDYVKYDVEAQATQAAFKQAFQMLEAGIEDIGAELPKPSASVMRARALALTKLEEAYMWVGKAIRDEQIARTDQAPLQEERTNG